MVLRAGSLPPLGATLLLRMCDRGGRAVIGTYGKLGFAVSENGVTPALRAISCSPICQCMASAARQGIDISSAIFAHMSPLNLKVRFDQQSESSVTRSGVTSRSIPLVQPRKLVLTIFVPFASSFKIILVVQTATDGASSGQMLADVLPFHTLPTKLNNLRVFLGRPFGLLLGRRLPWVRPRLTFCRNCTSH